MTDDEVDEFWKVAEAHARTNVMVTSVELNIDDLDDEEWRHVRIGIIAGISGAITGLKECGYVWGKPVDD